MYYVSACGYQLFQEPVKLRGIGGTGTSRAARLSNLVLAKSKFSIRTTDIKF